MSEEGRKDVKQVAPTSIPSKDIISSYVFSSSNRLISKYGERLLMEVIAVAQEYLYDEALGIHNLNFSEVYHEKFATIDIPIKNLLNADDTSNYSRAKQAAVELMKIYHSVESPVLDEEGKPVCYEDGRPQYQFASYHLLDSVTVNQKPGIVSVKLGAETWSQILDMGKGYTRYNLITAKTLNDVVAIRLFQLMSNTSTPLHFSIDHLKSILGLQDKYVGNTAGFVRKVIKPAEDEIRQKCPFEVVHEYVYGKQTGRGRATVSGIMFSKVMKASVVGRSLNELDPEIRDILLRKYGFDERGLRSNMQLFTELRNKGMNESVKALLERIEAQASKANSPQGYVINSLKNLLDSDEQEAAPVVKSRSRKIETRPSGDAPEVKKETKKRGGRLSVAKADDYATSELEEL